MDERNTKRKFSKSLLSLAAFAVVVCPLVASASVGGDTDRRDLLFSSRSGDGTNASAALYTRIKTESRKICGNPNLFLTGSLKRSADIEECYEGTVAAAVERLGNPQVSDLYRQEFGEL